MQNASVNEPFKFTFTTGKAKPAKELEDNVIEAANVAGFAQNVAAGVYGSVMLFDNASSSFRLSLRLTGTLTKPAKEQSEKEAKEYLTTAHAYVDKDGQPVHGAFVRFSDPKVQTRYEDGLAKDPQHYNKYREEQKRVVSALKGREPLKYRNKLTKREVEEKIYEEAIKEAEEEEKKEAEEEAEKKKAEEEKKKAGHPAPPEGHAHTKPAPVHGGKK